MPDTGYVMVETEHGQVKVVERHSEHLPVQGWNVEVEGHFVGVVLPVQGSVSRKPTRTRFQAIPTGAGRRHGEAPIYDERDDAFTFLAGIGQERKRSGTLEEMS